MGPLEWYRLVAALVALLCGVRMIALITSYSLVVFPMRRRIATGEVLAPPAGWALGYHLLVLALVLLTAERLFFGVRYPLAPSVATYCFLPVLVGLTLVADRFQVYYLQALRTARARGRFA